MYVCFSEQDHNRYCKHICFSFFRENFFFCKHLATLPEGKETLLHNVFEKFFELSRIIQYHFGRFRSEKGHELIVRIQLEK